MPHYILYSDESAPFTGRPVPYLEQDATRHWARHYTNHCMLSFYEGNPQATRQEVLRARAELVVCDTKMAHWRRHPNFDVSAAARLRAEEDRRWRG